MTPSTIRSQGQWKGVLRVNGHIIWICKHVHRNKDHSSHVNGISAQDCANLELQPINKEVFYKEPYSRTLPQQLTLF